ncbi:MAG: FAD:protein FMN transferase [Verrucomicrobia bacterium]|jgi:thiamine biosynthesis lipoprotein|nr:FAD:protein FMN transferase [Verrucomicrobiota bacterium]|tara:strand:+ start:25911 stop:26786 length:876 start_codon:yes stop_codon:yes gene_type:complete
MNRRSTLKILCGATLLPSVASASEFAFERPLMGTLFKIKTHTEDHELAEKANTEAFATAENFNSVASDYIADSELLSFSKLPHGKPQRVSKTLFPLLLQAQHFARMTKGNFDPTLGPMTKLWRESRRRKSLPSSEKLAAALAASGYQKLILNEVNRSLTFTVPAMRLDLGGIAKGQAADAMLAVFEKHGLPRTSITCGGDVRVGGPPPGKDHWTIAIKTTGEPKPPVELVNEAVSTSGDLHQFIEISRKRYSHIIDPRTGLGLTESSTATIVAETSAAADALATAACVNRG